jgi:nicotinamidase-related amidase
MKKWEAIFPKADRALVEEVGFGGRQSFGRSPALVSIDVVRTFLGTQPKPVEESTEEHITSFGKVGWTALGNIQRLLWSCRVKNVNVIFTTPDVATMPYSGGMVEMAASVQKLGPEGERFLKELKPLTSEVIILKTKASAFFGTPLVSISLNLKVDSLLSTGATPSGSVQASVVDAFSYKFPCFVVEDTFDRFELSYLVNLWEMNVKYADVINLSEALDYSVSMT